MSQTPDLKATSLGLMTLGALGVVYGDIGTSPLYAFREALAHAGPTIGPEDILGVLSLALWALILVVTCKYVLFLTRMDNNGEGGVFSLMALARRATAGSLPLVTILGACGAAMFYGDAIITPAVSVLSAVEGLRTLKGLETMELPVILLFTGVILSALFAVQSHGTARVAGMFGPICALWFLILAGLGLVQVVQAPEILRAFNPIHGSRFLVTHGLTGFVVLGAVFLTVTGAEALIADMGHFGRLPVQLGWMILVWPSLMLNYLGQGALALASLEAARASGLPFRNADWFFLLAPESWRFALVILAALATIIASQAVITGAYSLTQQGMSLGLLPRMGLKQTSASQIGQVYIASVNWMLLAAVLLAVLVFRTSSAMAAAYGIAVTGTMVLTSILAFIIAWRLWKWPPALTVVVIGPFLALDLVFFGANILRIGQGGWVPVTVAAVIGLVIATWVRGRRAALARTGESGIEMRRLGAMLSERPPVRVPGVAIFLTQDLDVAPAALLHNLKHNKSLHRTNILLRVETQTTPWVAPADRLSLDRLDDNFVLARLRYGYMDKVNVPGDLAQEKGLLSGPGGASFFVGRSVFRFSARPLLPRWMGLLYIFLHRNAADPTAYFAIPPNMVVELGGQVEL